MQSQYRVVAGLGNPGKAYEGTRHNIGFMVLDKVAEHYGICLASEKFGTVFGRGKIEGADVFLAKPMKYMNRSGPPMYEFSTWFRVCNREIVVIHDDMDLDFGRIKIKEKGGSGGHRGIKSLSDVFGGGDFVRIRMGIGRPDPGMEVTDYVLGKFRPDETEHLDAFLEKGRDAVVTVLCKGAREGMNAFNRNI